MSNVKDLSSLGAEYAVTTPDGAIVTTVQVIPHTDITDVIGGEYIGNTPYNEYLMNAKKMLTGFDQVDPSKILWYSTTDDEVVLSELIEFAVGKGYNKIILEHLADID